MRALCTVAITWKNRESSTPGSVVFANYASASAVHYVSHVGDDGTIVVHGDGFVRLECACRERHGSGGVAVSGPLSDARAAGEPHDAPVGVSEQGAAGRVDRRARARRTPCQARPGPRRAQTRGRAQGRVRRDDVAAGGRRSGSGFLGCKKPETATARREERDRGGEGRTRTQGRHRAQHVPLHVTRNEDKTLLKHHRGSYSPPSKHHNKKTPTISVGVFVVSNARSNRYEQKVTR